VARGKVTVNGTKLETGDGLKVQDTEALTIENGENAEVLVFDLPADRTLS
jgi:redox-sensitive bicupin YhaK (pirin superfamily)